MVGVPNLQNVLASGGNLQNILSQLYDPNAFGTPQNVLHQGFVPPDALAVAQPQGFSAPPSPPAGPPLQSALAPPAPMRSVLQPQPTTSILQSPGGLPSMSGVPYQFGQGAQGLDSITPPPLAKPAPSDDSDDGTAPDTPAAAAKPVSASGLPATMTLPAAGPAAPATPAASPSWSDKLGTALGGLGNLYGAGGPGDALIALGVGMSSGPGGTQRALGQIAQQGQARQEQQIQEINLQLQKQKLLKDQQSIKAGADYLQSIKPGLPRAQAETLAGNTSIMSSVTAGQFKTPAEKAEEAKLTDVPLPDGRFQKQWIIPGQAAGIPIGDPFSKQPLVNVDQRGEGAEAAKAGELAAARRGDLLTAADAAPERIARLRLLGNVLSQTQTGPLAGAAGKVVAVASQLGISPDTIKSLGLDPNQAVDNEVAQKLSNELVAGSIGAKNGGFPASNFSVAERQFIEKMFPSIASQPGSNAAVTDVLVARDERNIDKAQDWSDYKATQRQAGKSPSFEDWEDVWAKQHAHDNIFQPIIDRYNAGGYTPQVPSGGGASSPTGSPVQVSTPDDYGALPVGAHYIDPQGRARVKLR